MNPGPSPARRALVARATAGSTLVIALAAASPAAAQIYAAPLGTVNANCTVAQPCSLEAARDRVRAILAGEDLGADLVVYLRGGTYELEETFRLDAQDSGTNGHNVIYSAYPNETPVLSGGRILEEWSEEPGMPGVYATGRNYEWSDRHLFVNGVRAVRARGVMNPAGFTKTATGYDAPDATVASWTGPVEVVSHVEWKSFRCGVESASGTTITMKQPCWSNAQTHDPDYDIKTPTWFENARQLLDEEGEAYFESPPSTATTRVLYKPRAGENLSKAVIPAVETLLLLDGTPFAPVRNVQFHGITFAYAHWGRPSTAEGYPAVQGGFYYVAEEPAGWRGRPAAAVTARFAREVRFERNLFTHLGGAGLSFERGVQDSVISGNRFEDISSVGIMVGDVGPDGISSAPAQLVKNVTVGNNYLARVGAEYHDAVGIFASHPVALRIAHNELFDLPYTGISVGWTPDPGATTTSGVVIEANLVSHYMQLLNDGGGIYTQEPQPGSRIARNYLHTHAGRWAGIYLDNLTAYYTVTENVVADVPYWYFIQPYFPAVHNTITGNYSDEDGYPPHPGPPSSNTVSGNFVTAEVWPAAAQQIMAEAGLEPAYKDIRYANASLGRPTSASSQWDAFWTPPKAVDGSAQWGWASSESDIPSWWQVDLQAPHRIEDVELVARHRTDQPETRRSFDVLASAGSTFAPGTFVPLGGQGDAPFPKDDVWRPWRPTDGYFRHVRVARRPGFAAYNFVADLAVRTRRSVAEGKATQASSALSGYPPAAANNGLAAAGWSQDYADLGPSWWQVDLGAPHALSGVEIVGRPDFDQPGTRQNFEVRASNDPAFGTYVVVGSQGATPFPHQGVWATSTTPPVLPYRYVRVAKTVPEYFFLAEVRVFGVPAAAPALVSTGRPASASSEWDASYSAAKANDGLNATGWSPSGSDFASWWQVDLGSPLRVRRVELVSRQDLDQPQARRNFQVELSNDPTFATFVVAGAQGATSFPHTGTWAADPAFTTAYRYVRARKTAAEYFFIAELRVLALP